MAGLKHLCRCGKVIDKALKYCEECTKENELRNKEHRKNYDKSNKGKSIKQVYKNKQWKYSREAVKIRQDGLCLCCWKFNKSGVIDHVHHIIPTEEDKTLWYESSNLLGVCTICHELIHKAYKSSQKDKVDMQEYLRGLIKEYE